MKMEQIKTNSLQVVSSSDFRTLGAPEEIDDDFDLVPVTKAQLQAQELCNHVLGYRVGELMPQALVYRDDTSFHKEEIDVFFDFCPLCGVKVL
jgi:RIO-like serine/threonine protein kinase